MLHKAAMPNFSGIPFDPNMVETIEVTEDQYNRFVELINSPSEPEVLAKLKNLVNIISPNWESSN
jgi:uncharacterized protein (DUF1778 family)